MANPRGSLQGVNPKDVNPSSGEPEDVRFKGVNPNDVSSSIPPAPPGLQPQERLVKEGKGWRLGWDSQRPQYQGLVGGENWAFELTAAELEDFCRLSHQLADTMLQMQQELMEEERLCCEMESERLWLEVEGFPTRYGLRLILTQQRGAEGGWPAEAVPELLRAAQSLHAF